MMKAKQSKERRYVQLGSIWKIVLVSDICLSEWTSDAQNALVLNVYVYLAESKAAIIRGMLFHKIILRN